MSSPKINARLEHVTRKGDRRQTEEKPESWQDRLDHPHEDPLVQKVGAANGLPVPAAPAANPLAEIVKAKNQDLDRADQEILRLKRMCHALELNSKKLERALAAETVKRLDLEIERLIDNPGV